MPATERQPEVILDFVFDDGLFFISLKNIGAAPAYAVTVKFDKKFFGVEGTKPVSALPLFRNIPFFAPQKEMTTFLDTSASYFARRQPTKIRATINYQNGSGASFKANINHDLEIYRELGYVRRVSPSGFSASDKTRP